ncbi:hypothetical protein Ahy_B09g096349 isoform F [Arachis hypogaea]|uniref:Uncharacterized protein n=1 Tax=Arachis hypogaea TaxID=3818 RepID=A0A444XK86_ARAHY|nr:hypothetical protein Ahy_B09g096349 isoform F [Arachis hypogaea]
MKTMWPRLLTLAFQDLDLVSMKHM